MPAKFKSITVKTGNLLLDAKNTRIPLDQRSDDQRKLLHELLEHEDVRDLAASIAKKGFFGNDRPVVMPSGTRYIVLEGNRRLAAIKLLLSPDLAPTDGLVKYFRKLSSRADLASLASIEVSAVTTRVEAIPVIATLHVGTAKKRWSSLQQARFYREMVDEGQTPSEVAEDAGVTLGQVNELLRTEKLYRLALTLDYKPEVRQKLEDANFPLTTLARFVESTTARRNLGIELDETRGFRGTVHPDRFRAVLTQVAADVATVPSFTRVVPDENSFKAYFEKLTIPPTKARGSFDPDALLGTASGDSSVDEAESTAAPAKPRKPKKQSPSVVPRGFICTSKHDRVRAVFAELRQLNLQQQRNSTGVMLRVLLDIALWGFIKDKGLVTQVADHFDPDRKKRKYDGEWSPPLRDLISYVCEQHLLPGVTADGYKSVRSLASKDASYFITVDGFNQFTHNEFVAPTEGDLRALWLRAEPMLQVILS